MRRRNLESMPEDFLWIIYAQIHEAIDFLHNTCDPPIAMVIYTQVTS
jgi:hypothetical protein